MLSNLHKSRYRLQIKTVVNGIHLQLEKKAPRIRYLPEAEQDRLVLDVLTFWIKLWPIGQLCQQKMWIQAHFHFHSAQRSLRPCGSRSPLFPCGYKNKRNMGISSSWCSTSGADFFRSCGKMVQRHPSATKWRGWEVISGCVWKWGIHPRL